MDKLSKIELALKMAGLNAEEAACYSTLVQGGELSALAITRAVGVPRTSVYRALDALVKRGLVTQGKRNRRAFYSADHPRGLVDDLKIREKFLVDAIPDIEQMLLRRPSAPESRLYTGAKGFASAFNNFYDRQEFLGVRHIHSLSHPDLISVFPRVFAKSVERREALKIHIALMMPRDIRHRKSVLLQNNALRQVRYVSQAFAQNNSMLIGGDAILYISLKEEDSHAILLISESIAYLLREFFRVVWEKVAIGADQNM